MVMVRMLTDMLKKIPVIEADRIEQEIRREENIELGIIKKNMWRKWSGKDKILERKTTIPRELEKVEERMTEISRKIT